MDIDISKENIQPLRGGRNPVQLGTALQAQSDVEVQRQLLLQKEEHEAAIRNYCGSDPLEPWFNYIQWTEQCFPKHGHEGHIDKLIKDCLQLFEKDERYYQDRRLIKLWIKYIDCLANPLEIYQMLHNSGVGVEVSEFYRAWACYCEESGDYKKANQVYMLGLQAKAQPLDELEQAHMNFQLFFAQRMLHDDSPTKRKAASALAETRLALTSLKSFKRRNIAAAPVQRVGDRVRHTEPGTLRQQPAGYDKRLPNSNVMMHVYEDAASSSASAAGEPAAEAAAPASLVAACADDENKREVGIWNSAKIKMVHASVAPSHPLPFVPYEDEEDGLRLPANHAAVCADDLTFTVPLSVPDPPDPTKIACYNKAEVYVDDKEYSLEEIRARRYEAKQRRKGDEIAQPQPSPQHTSQQYSFNQSAAQCSALETLANCALDAEQEHLQLLQIPTLQNITKVTNMHSPGEPKTLVNLDSKEVSQLAGRTNDENQRPNADKENQAAPYYGRANLVEEFDRSLMGNLLGDSVTVNTKEARWELRNLFNDNEPSMVQPLVQQMDVPRFDIHEDRSLTMAVAHKKPPPAPPRATAEKENAAKPPAQPLNPNKTAYYEEPSCTQVFNFNIRDASTPNMSQFKKPTLIDQSAKSVPKFSMDESGAEAQELGFQKKEEFSRPDMRDSHAVDTQGAGLSVIMEATREYNSKSGSSSSGQSTRTNFTGYATPFSEKTQASNYDSTLYSQHEPSSAKRAASRLPNGQFARYPQKDSKSQPVPYLSHDHQYQKPMPQGYNGYPAQQRTVNHYPNYNYPQGYQMSQQNVPQGFGSPNPSYQSPQHAVQSPHHPAIQSPHHPGVQSPHHQGVQSPHHQGVQSPHHPGVQSSHHPIVQGTHHAQSPHHPGVQSQSPHHPGVQNQNQHHGNPVVQPGFQSPTYNQQMGYHSPGHIMSPQPYGREYQHYPNQEGHVYQQQTPGFQSPPHQNYPNTQYYQRPSQAPAPAPAANHNYSQQYHGMHGQYPANYATPQPDASAFAASPQQQSNQTYAQSPYRQAAKEAPAYGQPQQFQIYQSPQQHSYRHAAQQENVPMQTSPDVHLKANPKDVTLNGSNKISPPRPPAPHKSPTSALRNVRHDQSSTKPQNPQEIGFSNQFLNFISTRNEPKDNANTPKFTNSPSISQKMHKNLYVSSPEQAQIPPSSGLSDSDSKDSLTAQTMTPMQSAKVLPVPEKQKDISKRQLDFEHRVEGLQSEDSRDSVSKESRISSVYSRQSDFQSDGYGMDVDSENSMECAAFKSTHSISLIETSEIPRPADIEFPSVIEPFDKKLLRSLLEYVKFPNKTHADGYVEVRSAPKLQLATVANVGGCRYSVEKQLGKGNYGAVFLCLDVHNNKTVAVKYQKPGRPWEFYICQEVKARIKDPFMLPGYMDITTAFIGENASLFVSELSKYGSLLDVANKVRFATSKCINELIVFLLTSEMLSIVHYLHKAQIIHADIKPDNFLLMKIPTQEWRTPSLQLIDMGCAIDMSLFPEGTSFRELIATEGFTCTEMREGKPWTYQTDLYCLAGTIHVILMGSYMKVANKLGQWNIEKKLPRYMKVSLWDKVFTTLLNVPDCETQPDLLELKADIDSLLSGVDNLGSHLRTFANALKSR